MTAQIAIVAALARELHPLIKGWPKTVVEHEGRSFTFYQGKYAVVAVSYTHLTLPTICSV